MAMQKNKYVRLSIDLTMDEYRNLHKRVIEIGCPKSEFVRRAIKKALANERLTAQPSNHYKDT